MLSKVLILYGGGHRGVAEFKKSDCIDGSYPHYPHSYPYYGALRRAGVHVEVLSLGGRGLTDRKGKRIPWSWTVYLGSLTCVKMLQQFDVVVGWGMSTACLVAGPARLLGQNRKMAHISYLSYSAKKNSLLHRLRQRAFQSALRNAGRTILMTRHQVSEAIAASQCGSGQVEHLPIGVDSSFFRPDPRREQGNDVRVDLRAMGVQKYVVVCGDQLREEEDYQRILSGLGVSLVRLTQNIYTEEYWRMAVRTGTVDFPVFCVAHLSPQEIRFAYQRALCVLNFIDNTEQPAGWTVMTEAMACGLPAVVNAGLTTEELRSYYPKSDPLPFVEIAHLDADEARLSLKTLLSNADERFRLGIESRKFVERNLNIERTSQAASDILTDIAIQYRSSRI